MINHQAHAKIASMLKAAANASVDFSKANPTEASPMYYAVGHFLTSLKLEGLLSDDEHADFLSLIGVADIYCVDGKARERSKLNA